MRYEDFKALREQIQRSSFTRQQVVELFGDAAWRVCALEEPEFEAVGHDISDANEDLKSALDKVEDREGRIQVPA